MAKKPAAAAKPATKAKKPKAAKAGLAIPKRVAGVKIPKKLRKAGDMITDHPIISDVVAAGLLAAAAALTEAGSKGKSAKLVGKTGAQLSAETQKAKSRAKDALKDAANTIGHALLDEIEQIAKAKMGAKKRK